MRIIAIGGGEIGRPGYPVETTKIDKEIIALSGKKNPRVLFIPTASGDSEGYVEVFNKHFGKRLGCKTDVLFLIKEKPNKKQIRDKILNSDIVYVGGGNTAKLMKVWRKTGTDKILQEAGKKGVVLSGLSAGSICWFKYGLSDSRRFKNPNAKLIKVSGLGLINALHCPHYDFEKHRKEELKQMMKNTSGVAVAIDNCSAIEIVGDKYRIISSKKDAKVYRVYWEKGKFYQEVIKQNKEYKPLLDILVK